MIHPIPDGKGVGFTANQPQNYSGYDYRPIGRHHNYHFSAQNTAWPERIFTPIGIVIDAFSPNLNKHLHVGHLRNLAIANSLYQIFRHANTRADFVAFLGCSLGIEPGAEEELIAWFSFLEYAPKIYRDVEISEQHPIEGVPGQGEYAGCLVWPGTKHPAVLRRSDGRTTYAYHDLAFAKAIGPTHYLTGSEQFEHFANIGLADKHLPMGLVLDPKTGKKMKSRDGTALNAEQAVQLVIDRLDPTPNPRQLAWNITAWNFLRVNRSKDVAFDVDQWIRPEAPGLYITYTYARLISAIQGITPSSAEEPQENDVLLSGFCSYLTHYLQKTIDQMDPSHVAGYAHELAKKLNLAYHRERIKDGRPAFQKAICQGAATLKQCIQYLGMFPLEKV